MSLDKYILKKIIVPEATRIANNTTKLIIKKLGAQSASWGKVTKINSKDGTVEVEMTDGTTQTALITDSPVGINVAVLVKDGIIANG